MSEHVIIRQKSNFETEFLARDPHDPEEGDIKPVIHIHELTPYTMLLTSLGACTAIVLNTYAQNHNVDLHAVELELDFKRVFKEDCENCEEIKKYEEKIEEELTLEGDLTEEERQKLFYISKQCSIHKMMEAGIVIDSRFNQNGDEK